MPRLEKPRRANASLGRRAVLLAAPALLAASCDRGEGVTTSQTPALGIQRLNREIGAVAARAGPAVLGVGLTNLESGETYTFNSERRFPLQGAAKVLIAAAVLEEVDTRRLPLDERFTLDDGQLSPPASVIAEAWPARRDYTADELLRAAVVQGDNTAADVLMRRIGGPGAVTAWLAGKRVPEVRVDRYAREVIPDALGMASFRPEWRGAAFLAAAARIPLPERQAALRAHLANPRDTATPRGVMEFLRMLDKDELLSPASTRRLIQMMNGAPSPVSAGLPKGSVFSHAGEVGLLTLPDRRAYALAVFLAGVDVPNRAEILTEVARAAVRGAG